MAKNLTINQWITTIHLYKKMGIEIAQNYYLTFSEVEHKYDLKKRIKKKVKLYDNMGMIASLRKLGSGRPKGSPNLSKKPKNDINEIFDILNEEQKKEIIEDWLRIQGGKKDKNALENFKTLGCTLKSRLLNIHRTTFYKKTIMRNYQYDLLKNKVLNIFNNLKGIYGCRKIAKILEMSGIEISSRTLSNYMRRWNIFTKTRVTHFKMRESKNTKIDFPDFVKRNYNSDKNNIFAADVSYIPVKVEQNHVYLSVIISHKTKKIESWKLSTNNDSQLVLDTLSTFERKNFTFHSDRGTTYSSDAVVSALKDKQALVSMGRVGNSLDNREVEYFFGCLKGEYLCWLKTVSLTFLEVYKHIEWYNKLRIQKKLNWKTSAYADVINI
jgi:putative transposase